ncbi:MAG: O-antigen ligase family protein, partial [Gammaproteobacteria bacterium]
MNGLIILITALVIYVPNRLHFPESLGITGFNVFNLLLLITLVMMATHRHDPRRAVAIPRPPLVGALLLYYAVLGISLIQAIAGGSTHPWMDITIYKNIVTYSLLYFVAYYGVNDTRQMRFLIGVVVFVFLVASVEAIREGLDYGFSSYSNNHRAAGPFSFDGSNANYAGVFYGIFAPFVLAIAVMPSTFRPRLRFTALGCFLASTIAIFATFSRQSFLILGVTTLLITLRRNPLLGLAVILIIANYALWAPQGVINRVEMTQERNDQGQVVLEDSAESRYVLWNGALDIIHDHPMGIGFNQFQRVIDPYMPSWITARD